MIQDAIRKVGLITGSVLILEAPTFNFAEKYTSIGHL